MNVYYRYYRKGGFHQSHGETEVQKVERLSKVAELEKDEAGLSPDVTVSSGLFFPLHYSFLSEQL